MRNPPFWLLIAIINFATVGLLFTYATNIDYTAFYAAGRTAILHPHQLYDQHVVFESAGIWRNIWYLMPFCHLPYETILWAPLSLLTYQHSLVAWRLISVLLLFGAAAILARISGRRFWITCFQCCAFFPVTYSIFAGQDSVLLLLLISGCLYLLLSDKPVLAGVVLSLAIFKPQVPFVVALALLVARRYRAFSGFVAGCAAIMSVSFAYFGNWIPGLIRLTREVEPAEQATKMISLRGLFGMLTPNFILELSLICGAILLFIQVKQWSSELDIAKVVASAVLTGSLVAFHFHIQDVSILLLPIAVIARQHLRPPDLWALAPLFVPLFVLWIMSVPASCIFVVCTFIWMRSLASLDVIAPGT